MNHRERIRAAIRGEPTDHVPVALWRHFAGDDLQAETLAARVVEYQKQFEFDFVKVTPASSYPAEMYGATFRVPSPGSPRLREGTREHVTHPVNALEDWDKLAPLPATNPVFVRELAALKLIRAQLGPDVPILQTIFSPLNSALNLAAERLYSDLRAEPAVVHRALRALAETTALFAVASLRAGADAIFFATQMATATRLTRAEFDVFGAPYDRVLLEAIRSANPDFIFLHIHGAEIFFDAVMDYPVEIVNWHDRRTAPTLQAGRELMRAAGLARAISGGINEWDTLAAQARDTVLAEARDAITQTGGRGFVLASGCVIPVDTPEDNVRAVIAAARG